MPGITPYRGQSLEDARLDEFSLQVKTTFFTNATFGSATLPSTSAPGGLYLYLANGTDPSATSLDTAATFGAVAFTGPPMQIAALLYLQGPGALPIGGPLVAAGKEIVPVEIINVELQTASLVVGGATGFTGVTYALKGQAANPGVTTNGNIAFVMSLTGVTGTTAAGAAATFWTRITYRGRRV